MLIFDYINYIATKKGMNNQNFKLFKDKPNYLESDSIRLRPHNVQLNSSAYSRYLKDYHKLSGEYPNNLHVKMFMRQQVKEENLPEKLKRYWLQQRIQRYDLQNHLKQAQNLLVKKTKSTNLFQSNVHFSSYKQDYQGLKPLLLQQKHQIDRYQSAKQEKTIFKTEILKKYSSIQARIIKNSSNLYIKPIKGQNSAIQTKKTLQNIQKQDIQVHIKMQKIADKWTKSHIKRNSSPKVRVQSFFKQFLSKKRKKNRQNQHNSIS